jgi:uncharacterized protein
MKIIRIAAIAALVLAAAAIAGVGRPESAGGASAQTGGITVTGVGTVKSVPDEAQISVGVRTEGATANETLAENSSRMERLIAALKAAGVSKKDIRTEDVSIWPRYDSEGKPGDGYTARNSVTATIRDLGKAGAVIDAATRSGANEVSGPMLSSSAREQLEAKALQAAVRSARAKAEALADAAGVALGKVKAMNEGLQGAPEPYFAAARMAATVEKNVPIEPGTEEIQATVSVTFEIS